MSFYDDDERSDEDEQDEQQQQEKMAQLSVKDLRALRKAAKERDELQRERSAWQRERAFVEAGLDLKNPQLKYFLKAYDGEITPEAIRAAAEADGFLKPVQEGTTDTERQGHERIDGAASGSQGTGSQDPLDGLHEAAKSGGRDGIMQYLVKQGVPTSWNRPE